MNQPASDGRSAVPDWVKLWGAGLLASAAFLALARVTGDVDGKERWDAINHNDSLIFYAWLLAVCSAAIYWLSGVVVGRQEVDRFLMRALISIFRPFKRS